MPLFSFKHLIYLTFVLSLCVIALGAYTRLTEAGLGCPDWPGCYGFLSVPQGSEQQLLAQQAFPDAPVEVSKAWNEMVHRYFAGSLGLLILVINIIAWRRPETPKRLPALLLVTVIFQALLGMWTVTLVLMPVVVMGHLLGGFTTASLLLLLALRIRQREIQPSLPTASSSGHSFSPPQSLSSLQVMALAALLVVAGQIALGGWTAANYAAVACTQLPICEVDWQRHFDLSAFDLIQPEHDSYQYGILHYHQRVSIHVAHRIGAMVTTIVLVLLMWRLWRQSVPRRYSLGIGAVLALQLCLGITNVVASLPLLVAVGHNLVGVILLQILVATNYYLYCWRDVQRYTDKLAPEGRSHG
ncbi:COX15/CtaA family protein [Photobacterium sp.]|uniref:COX15/CtaA family protein n=1 Tax=Photobacterium sp. TaxID=660 RepID=UPI00299E2716|nr:COX15/CtaA family protein [Photobacterium sp.]MDX1302691.1 COX15/CtaA family protein [Photobacterium sp.]